MGARFSQLWATVQTALFMSAANLHYQKCLLARMSLANNFLQLLCWKSLPFVNVASDLCTDTPRQHSEQGVTVKGPSCLCVSNYYKDMVHWTAWLDN